MKFLLYISCFTTAMFAQENYNNAELIETLRLKYYAAVENSDSVEIFEDYLGGLTDNSIGKPVITAYRGALFAVKSKHAFWPFTKLSYLKDSMELLENAVSGAPENLEIRFIRFSILHYVPDFLGWNEEKEVDKERIVSLLLDGNYSGVPSELLEGITRFMIDSNRLTQNNIRLLNNNILLSLEK